MYRPLLLPFAALVAIGCATHAVPAARNTPSARVQMDLSRVSRVWVAGFVASSREDIDLNEETVRLIRDDLRSWSPAQVVDVEPLAVDTEDRIEDVPYWRRLAEEQGSPLVVTGSVKLMLAPPAIVQRGRRTFYYPTAGRVFEAEAVLIDGYTGQIVSRRRLPSRMRYASGPVSSGLSLYYQMMDDAMPDWLAAIAGASPALRSTE